MNTNMERFAKLETQYNSIIASCIWTEKPYEEWEWKHCSPALLKGGIRCGEAIRRACECAEKGSHDHLVKKDRFDYLY